MKDQMIALSLFNENAAGGADFVQPQKGLLLAVLQFHGNAAFCQYRGKYHVESFTLWKPNNPPDGAGAGGKRGSASAVTAHKGDRSLGIDHHEAVLVQKPHARSGSGNQKQRKIAHENSFLSQGEAGFQNREEISFSAS
jgi:hypothetical protein